MKNIILLLTLTVSLKCFANNLEMPGFRFANFKGTVVEKLAQAVEADDGNKVTQILQTNKTNIDFKDPIWQNTLLSLSIVNQKRSAFLALLKGGANPNILLGNDEDSTPFMDAIVYQENCDLYFIDYLLKYRADVNQKISAQANTISVTSGFPILAAVGIMDKNGRDCLNIIKLLLEHGANIQSCFENPITGNCDGVITKSLLMPNMETLKFFVIDQKVKIPNPIYIKGGLAGIPKVAYSLTELLNSKNYEFGDFSDTAGKHDRSEERNIRNEILKYLDQGK